MKWFFLLFPLFIQSLTIEEKVGQLLIVHFNGKEINEEARTLIDEAHIGGFIYYNWANSLEDPQTIKKLSEDLQKNSKIPLLICVDQEGGLVNRLKNGFTHFPGNYALGQTKNPHLAKECALAMGKELLSVGINMNLGPALDVNSNPDNPVIGIRSFSDNPGEVATFGKYALEGFKEAGIIAVAKHFPGHGDTHHDSHESLPIADKFELFPFKENIKDIPVVMTGHLLAPSLDPDHCATLSPIIVQEVLRKGLAFGGVLITDSLVMKGLILQSPSIEELAIQAFEAGHDILLLGGKQLLNHQDGFELTPKIILKIHSALVDAVKSGRISQDRLDESVNRILELKKKLKYSSDFNLSDHQKLAKLIAEKSVKVAKKNAIFVTPKKIGIWSPEFLRKEIEKTNLKEVKFFQNIEEINEWSDLIIICAYKEKLNLKITKPFILWEIGIPQKNPLFEQAEIVIQTFSPCPYSLQQAIDLSFVDTMKMGQKIWQNECGGSITGLTSWNKGEEFASLGIGHFIWYPEESKQIFHQTFPELLTFFRKKEIPLPNWLNITKGCPWKNRKEFLNDLQSSKMKELRQLLADHVSIQVQFMMSRLDQVLSKINPKNEEKTNFQFNRLLQTPQGIFAMLDYLNFKGEGLLSTEMYAGKGWGLLQVLNEMSETNSSTAVEEFVEKAKLLLSQRVKNSPKERNEQQWLKGWHNRLDNYIQ